MKTAKQIETQIEREIALGEDFVWSKRFGAAMAFLRDAERELAKFKAPAPSAGELETTWPGEFATYTIHFDYFEADATAGQHESVIINSIYANGVDVLEELSATVLEQIETHCFEVVADNRKESQMQAGEDIAAARNEERWAA